MHRLFNLCLWQVLFAGVLLTNAPTISAQDAGVSIRGPKSTDAYPYRRYGPINSNDTLWKIATKVRPSEKVSIYQVMQALYELNPQAFANNNINHLIDGKHLVIPTLADVRVVDENQARKKSQDDAKAWQSVDKTSTEEPKKIVEKSASQKDLEEAKVEINEQLQTIDNEQKGRLETIQRDVLDSIDGLQAILRENEALKKRLGDFNEQLGTMQSEVAKGQEVKRDMDDMLALQRELLAKVEERERQLLLEKERAFTSSIWFKILLGTIPTLLILSVVMFILRKKKQPETVTNNEIAEVATPEAAKTEVKDIDEPLTLDDELSLDGELSLDDELALDLGEDEGSSGLFADDLDDELDDELSDDDVIHLDDALDDLDDLDDLEDISLDENIGDDLDSLDELDDVVSSDDLGDVLLDEQDSDEGEPLEGGELDQNALDDLLSGVADDEEESEPLEGGELGQSDLDDLLSGLDTAAPDDSETDSDDEINVDDFLDDPIDSEDELTEIADDADVTDPDDIDALLASAASPEVSNKADEIADGADVTDPDDIDALLASAASPEVSNKADEIADDADVTDPDDIDALLASAASPEVSNKADEIADGADVTDPDDIDALLASAASPEVPNRADEIADGADVTDPDDIDALLASAASPEVRNKADEIADGADVTDPDDIDALLASAASPEVPNKADEIADGADVTDPDDIDALLASAASPEVPNKADEIADGADVTDPDDIDALLASAASPELPNKADEIADGADVTDPDDIDALLASAGVGSEPESASKAQKIITEPEDIDAIIDSLNSEVNEEPQQHEITDPKEIDALLEQEPIDDLNGVIEVETDSTEEESEHKSLIEGFSEEYVAPFLQVDFSDITSETEENEVTGSTEEVVAVDPAIDKFLNIDDQGDAQEDNILADDIDIDALISQEQASDDVIIDVGDDILGSISDSQEDNAIDDETLSAMEGDFDESTLSELLKEEKDPVPPVELTPDFTDSNVLADLLAEEKVETDDVSEANVIEDIQELDSLDFDELLANIEESSSGGDDSFDLTDNLDIDDEIDLGDDLDVDIDADSESIEDDFVSVDSLLSESLDKQKDDEPYNKTNIDVGLGDFPEFTNDINDVNVDDDDNGIAAKLDLAKVYIEIGDKENAEIILQDVVKLGDAQQQFDAQQLLDNL
ncbi:FimV/HubP family polar landmark protein [Thalassotalea atypica]|uniref:FimV/HubP family polar landmark protein n=1 Tax=Thalassotalea atypica TaxID=2054316 RepID=UPI0025728933|nr:FimV/HubP family polar landmark protein [Thalassotalea atypica]